MTLIQMRGRPDIKRKGVCQSQLNGVNLYQSKGSNRSLENKLTKRRGEEEAGGLGEEEVANFKMRVSRGYL